MAKILNHPRVYAFLHIPVQSGSDAVLADMKREYSSEDFCKIVDFLRGKWGNYGFDWFTKHVLSIGSFFCL